MPVAATAERPRREYLKVGLLAETVGRARDQIVRVSRVMRTDRILPPEIVLGICYR